MYLILKDGKFEHSHVRQPLNCSVNWSAKHMQETINKQQRKFKALMIEWKTKYMVLNRQTTHFSSWQSLKLAYKYNTTVFYLSFPHSLSLSYYPLSRVSFFFGCHLLQISLVITLDLSMSRSFSFMWKTVLGFVFLDLVFDSLYYFHKSLPLGAFIILTLLSFKCFWSKQLKG